VVKLLLAQPNINVNLTDKDGWTPLLWAVEKDYEVVVKLLLAQPNINVNLTSEDRQTLLL